MIFTRPLQIKKECGIVYHACEWDRNYMNKKHTEELASFLSDHEDEIEYVFLKDL